MSVTKDDVRRISRLAKINAEDAKMDALCGDLNGILAFVEQLNSVDCSGVEDFSAAAVGLPERADVAAAGDRAVMDNAPQKECNMFVVPKVIG
ncbi:MAG: Asp-tRNA(Asn)/Glu-tRNA(Gln) amidotransferase subunit GatC [Holosporaceae bacterium]|jgi:aspartyl-tRNA(Asn)/glutamyl-tRNA(Gln) amidotransferase subunit C|nr:Asp-tRNA(Asn)/Glu-tRNA(Gln) amidotransferase subunit GatC [Holosporaceae bacterium]